MCDADEIFQTVSKVLDRPSERKKYEKFLALKADGRIKWFVKYNTFTISSLTRTWKPYSMKGKLFWYTLPLLARLLIILNIKKIGPLSLIEFKMNIFKRISIYVGKPGPTQKLIVIVGEDSFSEVLKISKGNIAKKRIQQENQTLKNLPETIKGVVPKTKCEELQKKLGYSYTIQYFVDGLPSGKELTEKHIEFLASLKTGKKLDLSKKIISLIEKYQTTIEIYFPGKTQDFMALFKPNLIVPEMIQHGDFAPWNIKHNGRQLVVVDWEYAVFDGLPLFDMIHFFVSQQENRQDYDNILNDLNCFLKSKFVTKYKQQIELNDSVSHDIYIMSYLLNMYLIKSEDFIEKHIQKEGSFMLFLRQLIFSQKLK